MKFGGSSLADDESLRQVAKIIVERAKEQAVVVVVSAMGDTTNRLVERAKNLTSQSNARELDMLLTSGERQAMALLALTIGGLGHSARSLTGSQCGIITDHRHGKAQIVEVRPFRILDEIAEGHIVIVGGFQGVSYKREVTTLGRGGSDTTAVALAAALNADCEIYSDVDGIYTSDPRSLPESQRLDELSFQEAHAMSRAGAKVLHAQAIRLAQEKDIAIYTRRSAGGGGQTVIRKSQKTTQGTTAVVCDPDVSLLRLTLADKDDTSSFEQCSEVGSELGLLYFHVDHQEMSGILSLSTRDDSSAVFSALGTLGLNLGERLDSIESRGDLALISCIGTGLEEQAGLMHRALGQLKDQDIDVVKMMTDGLSIAFLINASMHKQATAILHKLCIQTP